MESMNLVANPEPRPWYDRLIQRFYGYDQPWPFPYAPSEHGICNEIAIALDWKDRIRVLLGGVVWTKMVIECEHDPGKTQTHSVAFVMRPSTRPR